MKKTFLIFLLTFVSFYINLDVCLASPYNNKTAVSVGKSYDDGTSSVEHSQEAYTSYYNMGLTSKLITNPTLSNLNASHANGTKYLESGIIYFAGHAGVGQMNYTNVFVYKFSGSANQYISMIDFNNSKSALVTFGGCETAASGNNNISYATMASGAKATMGWTTQLNISSYVNWNKRFHDKIETKTSSVLAAAQHASGYIYLNNNVKNYKIYGDSSKNPWYYLTTSISSRNITNNLYVNEKIDGTRSNLYLVNKIKNIDLDNYKLEINGVHETYYDYVLYVDDIRTNYGYTVIEDNKMNTFTLKNNMNNYTYEEIKNKIQQKQLSNDVVDKAKNDVYIEVTKSVDNKQYEINSEMKYYDINQDKLYYVIEVKEYYEDGKYELINYMREI